MAAPKTLSVYPNPFHSLDHEGHPCGTMPLDPDHAPGARRWVGATICTERTRILKEPWNQRTSVSLAGRTQQVNVGSAPSQRTYFAFELEPQVVLDSAYYRRAVADGSLLAADAAAAARCGVAFVAPMAALRSAATAAVSRWADDYGAPPPVDEWATNLSAILAPVTATAPARVRSRAEGDAS